MKMLLRLFAICMVLAFCASRSGYAQDTGGPHRPKLPLQLNTDMVMFSSPSTRLFLGWQEDTNALLQLGLDGILDCADLRRPGKELLRAGALALFTGAGYIVNQAFSLTAHDESHMEAARAIGATSVTLLSNSSGQEMNIFEFFLEAFNFTVEPAIYTYFKKSLAWNDEAYVASEGLDTNMLIAEKIGQRIDGGEGRITDLAPYVLNKIWGINYFLVTGPDSDAANYMELLAEQGYATGARNVIALNAASCLLSGGFLSLMKGAYDFIFKGESIVRPLELRIGEMGVFWPEITTWLNSDNVSLQASVDAGWKDIVLMRAGLDVPILGATSLNPELTIGGGTRIRRLSTWLELTSRFVGLPFFKGSVEYDLSDALSLGVEAFYGQRTTMRELREYPLGPGANAFVTVRF
jgi:hypothetical protein